MDLIQYNTPLSDVIQLRLREDLVEMRVNSGAWQCTTRIVADVPSSWLRMKNILGLVGFYEIDQLAQGGTWNAVSDR